MGGRTAWRARQPRCQPTSNPAIYITSITIYLEARPTQQEILVMELAELDFDIARIIYDKKKR
jgi:hypothetical protein